MATSRDNCSFSESKLSRVPCCPWISLAQRRSVFYKEFFVFFWLCFGIANDWWIWGWSADLHTIHLISLMTDMERNLLVIIYCFMLRHLLTYFQTGRECRLPWAISLQNPTLRNWFCFFSLYLHILTTILSSIHKPIFYSVRILMSTAHLKYLYIQNIYTHIHKHAIHIKYL